MMNSPDFSEKRLITMHKADVTVTAMMGNRSLRFMECFLSITYLTPTLPLLWFDHSSGCPLRVEMICEIEKVMNDGLCLIWNPQ
jgi:hypothetical protein